MTFIAVSGWALMLTITTSCYGEENEIADIQKPISIARNYILERYPRSSIRISEPVVLDNGRHWVVSYRLPRGYAGGTPTVVIDKQSQRVIHFSATQ
jgi:hypothetical protein